MDDRENIDVYAENLNNLGEDKNKLLRYKYIKLVFKIMQRQLEENEKSILLSTFTSYDPNIGIRIEKWEKTLKRFINNHPLK